MLLFAYPCVAEESETATDPGGEVAAETLGVSSEESPGAIRPGDRLNIQIYREKDMSGIFTVDASGNINYYFLGEIHVEGWTLGRLNSYLTEALGKDLLYNPQIQVAFEVSLEKKDVILSKSFVSILGQVNRPANYPHVPGMTLVRLLSEAGGFAPAANQSHVTIIRQSEGKEQRVLKVNVSRILSGKEKDAPIEPQDVVVVPESFF